MDNPLKPPTSPPKRSRVVILIALALLLMSGSLLFTGRQDPGTFVVTFANGKEIVTEVADTPEKIFFGLAFREQLPQDHGMLYIFGSSDRHQLTTKGFLIPVDMIWLDESKYVVHTVEQAPPCSDKVCPQYGPPPINARYVIQTAAGFIYQEGVKRGDGLTFTLRMR